MLFGTSGDQSDLLTKVENVMRNRLLPLVGVLALGLLFGTALDAPLSPDELGALVASSRGGMKSRPAAAI